MAQPINDTGNTIAHTLLHVGERVLRVSKNEEVIGEWVKDNNGAHITSGTLSTLGSDPVIALCIDAVKSAIATGHDQYITCGPAELNILSSYNVRVLNICPDKDAVYIVIENTTRKAEDNWKLALDASADGMWDMNMITRKVIFSDKWHKHFDQYLGVINDTASWADAIHPQDLVLSQERIEQYLSGKLSHYSCELRYKCKDDNYRWIQSMGVVVSRDTEGRPLRAIGTHRDIHQQKLNEQQHFSTAQLLSTLIENLQDGILVIDGSDNILFANQSFCNIYEISGSPAELKGTPITQSIADRSLKMKDPAGFSKRTAEIHNARQLVLNDEIELINGKTYSRDFIPITLANEEKGEIWKLRDITEQKNAQKRFEEQRLFYERILNSIPEDIAVHDPQHRFLFLNPAAIKDDVLRKWMIGKNHEDYFTYRNKPLDLATDRNKRFEIVLKEKKPYEWVEKVVNKEGKTSHHLRCLFPLLNDKGEIDLVIVFGANITDRILAEQELKKSRDTFANAFNHSGSGMALLTPHGKWLEVNQALCDITGYSKEELLNLTFQDITYPGDLAQDQAMVNRLLNNEINYAVLEKRYISKSKKIVWALLSVSLVWNDDGTPGFYIAQIVDITARKTLEAELSRKNTELEAARISLVNKINQMDDLSHIIAHNLRGPIGNIQMLSDTKDSSFESLDRETILDLVHESSISLMDSLNTLMEMTSIKLNKDLKNDDCNFTDIIAGITNQLHGVIYESGVKLQVNLQVEHIYYPKVYLESILYNLISNAIKYSAPGREPQIIIATYFDNGRAVLSVKDNGLGIDMARYENKVFQLNQVFHAGHDSKGVGLFITKTQIESLGGTIIVKSQPDKGSEFIVTF